MEKQNKIGGKIDVGSEEVVIAQVGVNKMAAIGLTTFNSYRDPIEVVNKHNLTDDEMIRIVGEHNWKRDGEVTINLNDSYSTKVVKGATEIKVGCQTIPVSALRAVLAVIDGAEPRIVQFKDMEIGQKGRYIGSQQKDRYRSIEIYTKTGKTRVRPSDTNVTSVFGNLEYQQRAYFELVD